MKLELAVYPGTFDPFHRGHLELARLARDLLGVTVLVVPDAAPMHRPTPHFDHSTRLALIRAALRDEPRLVADGRSASLEQPTRTLELIRSVRAETKEKPYLLLSDEIAATLPTWEDPAALVRSCRLVIIHRPGSIFDRRALVRTVGPVARRITFIDAKLPDCRATLIRAALAAGRDPGDCLPLAVRAALAELTAPAPTPAIGA